METLLTRRSFVGLGALAASQVSACAARPSSPELTSPATPVPPVSDEPVQAQESEDEHTIGENAMHQVDEPHYKHDIQMIDLHCDTVGPLGISAYEPYATHRSDVEGYTGDLASNECMVSADRVGDMDFAQCYAIWTPDDCPSCSYHKFYRTGADWFLEQMKLHADRFEQVRDFSDLRRIWSEDKVAALLTVENSVALEDGMDVVDEFVADGVKIAGLTWNGVNVVGSGSETDQGLSSLGVAYVRHLEEANIVVDVSHLNDRGFFELAEIATRPFIATHSNSRAVCNHVRNLTDEQFGIMVERQALVGLNLYGPFVANGASSYDFTQLIAHIEHWLDLGGHDVIALGADRDGADIPAWIADVSTMPSFYELCRQEFGEELTRKLFAENCLAFFERYEQG